MRILHCSRVSPGPLAPDFTPALWSRTREPREAQRAGRLDFRAAEDVRRGTAEALCSPLFASCILPPRLISHLNFVGARFAGPNPNAARLRPCFLTFTSARSPWEPMA